MKLTPQAQQQLDFSKTCLLQGMCTTKEYMKAVKAIYKEDLEKQIQFLVEQGFSQIGAFKNIYNLDSKEAIL